MYLALIMLTYGVDRVVNRDVFSALKLCAYFALLEAGVMLWFALRPDSLFSLVLVEVVEKYVQEEYIIQAYGLSVLTYSAVAIGIAFGAYTRWSLLLGLEALFIRTGAIAVRGSKFKALTLFSAGFALHVWVIQASGGYTHVWSDLNLVEITTAPFGLHKALYTFLITIGMSLVYPYLYKDRQFILLMGVILAGLFGVGALGQRAPVGIALFVLLLTHHYCVQRFTRIFSARVVVLAAIAVGFMFMAVQWRHGNIRWNGDGLTLEPKLEEFEMHVVQRLGVIERQVSAIGYMDHHQYWGLGIYRSLFHAYRSRAQFPDKLPVDTGVYLKAISEGAVIDPPRAARDMPETSWPDRYLAGYLSFGIVGLLGVAIVSGMVFGVAYRVVIRRKGSSAAVFIYGVLGFLGATPLSPLGVVKVGLTVVPTMIIGWLFSFTPVRRRTHRGTAKFNDARGQRYEMRQPSLVSTHCNNNPQ